MRNNYTTSENGIAFIAAHEGEVLEVYRDPVGLPTLGVGHLLTPSEKKAMPVGTKITRQQSREFLAKDLARFERAVNGAVKVPITQNQFDALVSFSFNVGESAFKRSSVLRNLNNRKFAAAADSLLLWNKAGGKVLKGLVRRRKEERELFLTPDKESAAPATDVPGEGPASADVMSDTDLRSGPPTTQDATEVKALTTNPEGTRAVEVTQKNEQDVNETVQMPGPEPYRGVGFWKSIKNDLLAATGGNLSFEALQTYAQQASGWPEWVVAWIGKLAIGALIATVVYFIFRVLHYGVDRWQQNQRTRLLAEINTDINRKNIELVRVAKK